MIRIIRKKEIWKWVHNYKGLYKVSNLGRVKSVDRIKTRLNYGYKDHIFIKGRILVQGRKKYCTVALCKNGKVSYFRVHRLVLEVFEGLRPPGMQCRHLNDIKTDNRWPENICWGTRKENGEDAVKNGRTSKGINHGKLVWEGRRKANSVQWRKPCDL